VAESDAQELGDVADAEVDAAPTHRAPEPLAQSDMPTRHIARQPSSARRPKWPALGIVLALSALFAVWLHGGGGDRASRPGDHQMSGASPDNRKEGSTAAQPAGAPTAAASAGAAADGSHAPPAAGEQQTAPDAPARQSPGTEPPKQPRRIVRSASVAAGQPRPRAGGGSGMPQPRKIMRSRTLGERIRRITQQK
jgi:hypothetical protein